MSITKAKIRCYLYKGIWIFIIGGIVGYFIEVLYGIMKKGALESRQGMLYGPFSQIYGLGALIIVIITIPLIRKSNKWIFSICAIFGGLFEFICSWIQEFFWGVQSWDYSPFAISLTGRTSLIYMVFWGVLGVFFIRYVYPKISLFIDRIIDKVGGIITWILVIFLIFDAVLTTLTVNRWAERQNGVLAQTFCDKLVDIYYPDDLLRDIFPQMELVNK
ncbi:putative ABC transporter permease [Anaerocolumna sp. AGMB13025]|uniref:putative ABC transporter permease n=1 Tax=Anaerocolumna sp. AGMB13025 TaxID=3039116 RepID=UPI0024201A77|nr:putative ABC transporter permease [Anaerocolumna sp. AGMB13025]WFR56043.1 putative ABC transporter permease [Anaerocolumna sp. AGMB13025]